MDRGKGSFGEVKVSRLRDQNDEAVTPGKPAFAASRDSWGGTRRTKRSSRMLLRFDPAAITSLGIMSSIPHEQPKVFSCAGQGAVGIYWSWLKHCQFRTPLVRTRTP